MDEHQLAQRSPVLTIGRFFFVSLLLLFVGSSLYFPGRRGWIGLDIPYQMRVGFGILFWIGDSGMWFTVPILIYRWLRFRRFSALPKENVAKELSH
jgi:hypothetical protein